LELREGRQNRLLGEGGAKGLGRRPEEGGGEEEATKEGERGCGLREGESNTWAEKGPRTERVILIYFLFILIG
jgi:hypothetical protein